MITFCSVALYIAQVTNVFLYRHSMVLDIKSKQNLSLDLLRKKLKEITNQSIPEPEPVGHNVCFEGYWVSKGVAEISKSEKVTYFFTIFILNGSFTYLAQFYFFVFAVYFDRHGKTESERLSSCGIAE